MPKQLPKSILSDAAEMKAAGMTPDDIARELEVSVQSVYRYLKMMAVTREPKGWTEAVKHVGEICEDYNDGASVAEIARRYETTEYCVREILHAENEFVGSSEARRLAREAKEQLVIDAYNAGQRIVDISAQQGVGQGHIYTILARHGIRPGRRLEAIRRVPRT